MRIALLQLNPTVGDLAANARNIVYNARLAFAKGADLCVTSELAVMGYPPADLLLSRDIIDCCIDAVKWTAENTADLGPMLVGTPFRLQSGDKELYNGACLTVHGRLVKFFGKTLLPNYDVFDEQRYFTPYASSGCFELSGCRIGVTICEDIWNDPDFWSETMYGIDPVDSLTRENADLIINMSASPFSLGKQKLLQDMLAAQARKHGLPFLFCNQVGGNDDLVFAGRSMALDRSGKVTGRAREFVEDILIADLNISDSNCVCDYDLRPEPEAWNALVLGLRDYLAKSGFSAALLGLSGGIDSALVACAAAEALGPENVTGVLMPSVYSSRGSIDDSLELAANLGIKTLTIPIGTLMESYESALAPVFGNMPRGVTEENIQSRIRGSLLMAISNKLGGMVLATGNKSELSVGYCTIYGDMCGGLAPISDVPKTLVYSMARWINSSGRAVIPEQIITKVPSAELRPNQKDQDSLPDYEILDQILQLYIEQHLSPGDICARGFEPEIVDKVAGMVKNAEFKRRQSPPGLKITGTAFGRGWRMPLASRHSFVAKT